MPLIEDDIYKKYQNEIFKEFEDNIYKEFEYDENMYIFDLNFLLNDIYNINIYYIYRKIELDYKYKNCLL